MASREVVEEMREAVRAKLRSINDEKERQRLHNQLAGAIDMGYLAGAELQRIEASTMTREVSATKVHYRATLKHHVLEFLSDDTIALGRPVGLSRKGASEKEAVLAALEQVVTAVAGRAAGYQRLADCSGYERDRALAFVVAYKDHLVELQNLQKRILGADPHLTVESTSR